MVGAAVLWVGTPIPDPNKDFTTANTHLLYRDGKTELGVLSVQNHEGDGASDLDPMVGAAQAGKVRAFDALRPREKYQQHLAAHLCLAQLKVEPTYRL